VERPGGVYVSALGQGDERLSDRAGSTCGSKAIIVEPAGHGWKQRDRSEAWRRGCEGISSACRPRDSGIPLVGDDRLLKQDGRGSPGAL